jgi:hypothetical protein
MLKSELCLELRITVAKVARHSSLIGSNFNQPGDFVFIRERLYRRPKVVRPFLGPCASRSYMHRAAFFVNYSYKLVV